MGREPERERFAAALAAEPLPYHVVHVYGPGGIGKTALLDEYRRLGAEAGVAVARVDGRDLAPTPSEVARAVEGAFGRLGDGRRALLVDTYEALAPLDDWFRRTFIPGLPQDTLVVLAGRRAPASEWRAEWGDEVCVEALGNLSPSEGEAFLDGRGVPPDARAAALAFTRGHPLALALVADRYRQSDGAAFRLDEAPDVVGALLTRFVASVPSSAHRAALEGAALVRSLTEPLLAALLPDAAAPVHGLFGWLRTLSFVEADAHGLHLHDLVRDVIEADLRWRDPDRHDALHTRAREFFSERLQAPLSDEDRHRVLGDYVHLYRDNPIIRPLITQLHDAWAEADLEGSGPMEPGDAEAIGALVARHEGEASAEAVGHWLRQRPEAVEVYRRRGGGLAGFLLTLSIDDATVADREADPAVRAAWDAVAPRLRPGERAVFFRSWMDAEAHQGVSAVQSLIFARTVQVYLSTPDLAVSLLACATPELWAPALTFVGLRRWTEAEVEGAEAAVFGKDWRAMPPLLWLDTLATRASATGPDPTALAGAADFEVLSESSFAEAVRDALRAYGRPHRLEQNPLIRSRLVREHAAGGDGVDALRALLAEAAEELRGGRREIRYYRALDLTYFRAAPTQAIAAERLGLPFSTYRRHLGRGVDHVVEALWRREIGSR